MSLEISIFEKFKYRKQTVGIGTGNTGSSNDTSVTDILFFNRSLLLTQSDNSTLVATFTLVPNDIPTLAISKINGLQDALDSKFDSSGIANYYTNNESDTLLNGKFNMPVGTQSQYIRGDGSLAEFPSVEPVEGGSVVTGISFSNRTLTLIQSGLSNLTAEFSLIESDIPTLAVNKIDGLQSILDTKSNTNHTHTFASITNKPTTLAGYGITDVYTKSESNSLYDNYQSFNLRTNNIQRTTIQSNGVLDLVAGSNMTISYSAGGTVTFNAVNTQYTHPSSNWVNKNDLTGGLIINNLSVDGLGHLTNWTTRTLLASDINAEVAFSKNTGFNKNFGTVANTVAQGNDQRILNGQTAFGWGNHSTQGYLQAGALNNYYTINQTDNLLLGKYNNPVGTQSQYIRGDGSIANFPSIASIRVTSMAFVGGTLNLTQSDNTTFASTINLSQVDIPNLNISKINNLQSVLDSKQPLGNYATVNQLHNPLTLGANTNGLTLVNQILSMNLVSQSVNGAMTSQDKIKLDSINVSNITEQINNTWKVVGGITNMNQLGYETFYRSGFQPANRPANTNYLNTFNLRFGDGNLIAQLAMGVNNQLFSRYSSNGGNDFTPYVQYFHSGMDISALGGTPTSLLKAGDTGIGALRYAGLTKTIGELYGGTSNPSNTTRLNFDGNLHANSFIVPTAKFFGNGTEFTHSYYQPIADGSISNVPTGKDHFFRVNGNSRFRINDNGINSGQLVGGSQILNNWKFGGVNTIFDAANTVTRTISVEINGIVYELYARVKI